MTILTRQTSSRCVSSFLTKIKLNVYRVCIFLCLSLSPSIHLSLSLLLFARFTRSSSRPGRISLFSRHEGKIIAGGAGFPLSRRRHRCRRCCQKTCQPLSERCRFSGIKTDATPGKRRTWSRRRTVEGSQFDGAASGEGRRRQRQ